MTPAITPYFDPNQMPPWLRGGPRLNLGGVLGAPPRPMMPPTGAMPPYSGPGTMPGNVFNSTSLLQAPPSMMMPASLPPNFGAGPAGGASPRIEAGGPVGLPTPQPGAQRAPLPDPVGGPGGIAGPYQPISQTLNPMGGMPQGRPRMSRPGMASTF